MMLTLGGIVILVIVFMLGFTAGCLYAPEERATLDRPTHW